MGQNSIISFFFARRAKKASAECQSPPQELEVGPRSGPYLLVNIIKGFLTEKVEATLVQRPYILSVLNGEVCCPMMYS